MLLPSAFTTSVFAVSDRIQMEIWNTRADLVWASHMAYNSKWIFKGALHPGHSVNKWWSVSGVVRIPFSEWLHIKVRWRGSRHGQGQGGMNGDNVTQSLFEVLAVGCTPRKSSCRRMKKDSLSLMCHTWSITCCWVVSFGKWQNSAGHSPLIPTSEMCERRGFTLGLQLMIVFTIDRLIV